VQRFIAGWSSPVARQAHNLKVTGSNPVPATRKKPVNSVSWRVFSCTNLSKSALLGPIQQVLVNPRLSHPVASCVGSSMSQARHMESDLLFSNRSSIKR
jgi:hypothetical protein